MYKLYIKLIISLFIIGLLNPILIKAEIDPILLKMYELAEQNSKGSYEDCVDNCYEWIDCFSWDGCVKEKECVECIDRCIHNWSPTCFIGTVN